MQIPFATTSYQSESLFLSAQRLVNLYAERIPEEAKSPVALFGTPELKLRQTVGVGPNRGQIVMNKKLFIVSGPALWRVEGDGSATNIGVVPGNSSVQMSHNGTQIAVLTGGAPTDLFIATETNVTQVTDPDYPGASSVAFLDGYFLFTETASGRWFICASYNGLEFDALEFATAEGSPDNLIRVFVNQREAWLFGEETTEVWYNSGNADFPFERASGANIERGTVSGASISGLDNSLIWVGEDRVIYRADGYRPTRISTHPIEEVLESFVGLGDLISFSYTQKGHAFYVLKKPGHFTFVYDVSTGLWHERESHGRPDYRVSWYSDVFGARIASDDKTGNIYEMDITRHGSENGESVVAIATSPPLWAKTEFATMNSLIVDVETGVGLNDGQGADPQIMLDWSDDGGKTWSNEHWTSMGKIGEYTRRAKWDRMGQFYQRVLRVRISDPVRRVMNGAYADIERGRL